MKMISCVKKFFEKQGLNWTGKILAAKDKDFRKAGEQDFEILRNNDYLISFGKDGEIALSCEIDLMTFKINGESFDCVYNCYAGDNEENKKLCEERDLSKDFINFQLKNRGLIYAVNLKKKCEKEKDRIHIETASKVKKIEKKIEVLNKRIIVIKEEEKEEINQLIEIEKMAEKVEERVIENI